MNKKISTPLKARLWQFSFTAAAVLFCTAIAIAITFFMIHQQQVQKISSRSELINRITIDVSTQNKASSLQSLEIGAKALIQLEDFNSVTLINASGDKYFEYGMPIAPESFAKSFTQETKWLDDGEFHISHKISNINGGPAWLITRIDLTQSSLLNLQFQFFTLLILIIVLTFSILFHRKLNRDIFNPLETLNDLLAKQNKMREMAPIRISHSGILDELIQQTNEIFSIQIEKEMDFKSGVDSTTQELRESLETVEIHNIDLDMARKNAVELNKLKSDFLKKVSQDLRTPLRGILSFSELIKKEQLNTRQAEHISTIEDSTKGLLTIVNDIHDFSRLESGKFQLNNKPLNITKTIEETLTLQSGIALERGVTLYSSVDPDVPQSLLGDTLRVQQILSSLIANAIKFDQCDCVEVTAQKINQNGDDVTLQIHIKSDGYCPEELLDWQNDSDEINGSKAFYSGAGMGLSVAKGVAYHMKGKIEFENADSFRCFSVFLSLSVDKESLAPSKIIDPSYQISAIVYSNNDIGYREITSRLYELGIHNIRATTFSEILTAAKKQKEESLKHARFLPLAVIEAQTSQQTLDKIVLTQTIKTLAEDFHIPSVIIAPLGKYEQLTKILKETDASTCQHPIISSKFRSEIMDQLGILRLASDANTNNHSHAKPLRVLVVDDNNANLKLATALLKDFQLNIDCASSGEEAISAFNRVVYDMVFMDIQLPDIDGYETTKRMRTYEQEHRRKTRTPIIALTAHNVQDEKMNLLIAGMDDFIGKPLTKKDIEKLIARWVGEHRIQPNTTRKKNQHLMASGEPEINDKVCDVNIEPTERPKTDSNFPPVSISECLKLCKDDPILAKDMLGLLIESLPHEKSGIQAAKKESNFAAAYEHIHRLHGACCYCGVPKLKVIAKTMDERLRREQIDEFDIDCSKLFEAIDELLIWSTEHDISALFDH